MEKQCELWQLTETGPRCYTLEEMFSFHEALDMQAEAHRRAQKREQE